MLKKYSSLKSVVYLLILSVVLVFSLYNLLSENARSWFSMNKLITVNPVYGRVLTSGAGRNLVSFRGNDAVNLDFTIIEESDPETATLRMVPGDTVHFVFLVSFSDLSIFEDSTLVLNGVFGGAPLRGDCMIMEGAVRVCEVAVAEDDSYEYMETWQSLNNSALPSLGTDENELEMPIGAVVTGEPVENGAYEGYYLFLVDIPVLYRDTGENQNEHKAEYDAEWVPSEDESTGVLIIERCIIIREE